MSSEAPATHPRAIGIAFGSNLGDRLENLTRAKAMLLERVATSEEAGAFSAVYESAPVDCEADVDRFFNAVGEIHFKGDPDKLLSICQEIEHELGRPSQRAHHAPRPIDLDLLYAGDLVTTDPHLVLPHPRLVERRFVLEPLASIRPSLVLPGQEATIAELLDALVSEEPPLRPVTPTW